MSGLIERESESLHAALDAAEPRLALREAVRTKLRLGMSRRAVLAILSDFSAELEDEQREHVLEIMDLLEGWASPSAIESFFEGLPERSRPDAA